MSQLQHWFKKYDKELWDDIDLRGSGCKRPSIAELAILKLIDVWLLELRVDKYKRGSATDLIRVKWALDSVCDEHWHCYKKRIACGTNCLGRCIA